MLRLMGAAYMYNHTAGATIWEERINLLINATNIFYVQSLGANLNNELPPGDGAILSEVACERGTPQTCNQDQPSFKAYTSRWLALTTVLAPFTRARIWPRLEQSALGAASQCVGNAPGLPPGTACGRRWYQSSWDGYYGVGEEMSALSAFQSLLISQAEPPLTHKSGGTSVSDPEAGLESTDFESWIHDRPMTTGDVVGASLLTVLGCGLPVLTALFMSI